MKKPLPFRSGKFLRFLPALLILAFCPALRAEVLLDEWARVMMGGNQIGYYHVGSEKTEEEGKTVIVSVEESNFAMKRAGVVVNLMEKSETREDEDGRVLSFKMERRMGGDLMEVSGKTEGEQMKLLANGMASKVDYPKGALGPNRIDVEMRKKGFAPGTKSEFVMFDREDPGVAATLNVVILAKEKLKIGSDEGEWVVSDSTISNMPGLTVKTWSDDEGNFEMIRMPMGPMGTIEMQKSTKEVAMQEAKPAEIFMNTLIVPSRPIPSPEKLKQAKYRLTAPKALDKSFYTGDGQKVESKGDGVFEIEVNMPKAPPPEAVFKDAPLPDPTYAPYLKPSPFLQSNDPTVIALAKQIAGNESNALVLASRIQQGVYVKISKKNLNTGIASAAAVAQSLEGDCTEHAVLCAAIGRALGLPSRVVVGMVYAPTGGMAGNFGYHMWAEVLVAPGVWWPVDAAFARFDVTHIALAKSAMEKPNFESELITPFFQMMGDLKIEVLETR